MVSARKDPKAWRDAPAAVEAYKQVRAEAQAAADRDGYDRGVEANDLFRTFRQWMLPAAKYRCGHELLCEVVSCTDHAKIKPGHGPGATRVEIGKVFR